MEGAVRGVGRDVGEERFFLIDGSVDKTGRRLEVEVGAIPVSLNFLVVVKENRIGVAPFVFDRFGGLSESTAAMQVRFLKSLITGAQRVVVPEMPFAKNADAKTSAIVISDGSIIDRPLQVSTTRVR